MGSGACWGCSVAHTVGLQGHVCPQCSCPVPGCGSSWHPPGTLSSGSAPWAVLVPAQIQEVGAAQECAHLSIQEMHSVAVRCHSCSWTPPWGWTGSCGPSRSVLSWSASQTRSEHGAAPPCHIPALRSNDPAPQLSLLLSTPVRRPITSCLTNTSGVGRAGKQQVVHGAAS